jgi:hypothetical protein
MLGKLALVVGVLGLLAGWTGSARAENAASAREHYQRGTKFYDIGRYDEAIREFEAAYEAKSDPAFIYNLAQAHRLAGHNQEALQLYRNYLRYVPSPPNRSDIVERIRVLEKAVADRPPSTPAPVPGESGTAAAGTTPPAPPTETPAVGASPTAPGPASPEHQPIGAPPGYPPPGQPEIVGASPPQQPPPVTPDYGVAPLPPASPPPAAAPRSSRKKAGVVIAAIGGAFLVGGAVSGLVAWSSSNSVQKAAENGETFDPSVEKTGRAAAVLQWVGYGIGAAGVAVGLILVATSPSAREGARPPVAALPLIGPGVGGAAVRMTF